MTTGVEFEEDKLSYGDKPRVGVSPAGPGGGMPGSGNEPKMVKWLMRHGLAKSANSAQMILIGVFIVNIILIFIIIRYIL